MVKQILTYPEDKETLTLKSAEVTAMTEEIKCIIQDLKDTLKNTKSGVGISAIQIGLPFRICIIKYNGEFIPMINPIVTKESKQKVFFREGCLSAPSAYSNVERSRKVTVEYLDEEGKKKVVAQGGLFSIIVQHELDHFDGWCKVFDEVTKEDEENVD